MKILTIVGTRPELIRLSVIIEKLDKVCKHILVDTKQNKQHNMSQIFYDELNIRKPNYTINFNNVIDSLKKIIKKEQPDKALILGDTNTSLCAILIERMGIPVYHMEAGNRCYDRSVPEEINRRAIDAISSFNLPYTEMSKQNLLKSGIPKEKIFVTGNPIYEVYLKNETAINKSKILQGIGSEPYLLVTCHRAETVDYIDKFKKILDALLHLSKEYKIIFPIHPRTKTNLEKNDKDFYHKFRLSINILIMKPLGFLDFIKLEKNACIILTDSGTVQEEACILGVPSVILRNSTERQEIVESGCSIIAGVNTKSICDSVQLMSTIRKWQKPKGYLDENVSNKVIQFLIGHQL